MEGNELAAVYARTFATSEGKTVLESLHASFKNKRLTSNMTADQILVRAGMHDAIQFIDDMIAAGKTK